MEMTDSQFKGVIRFVLDALAEMKAEHDTAKREEKRLVLGWWPWSAARYREDSQKPGGRMPALSAI